MSDKAAIILTDADARIPASANCPRCNAPAKERIASNGFGLVYDELCGKCGFNFGEKRRG